jgi:UDP:flavonoid glycosyltransferase YjiC (YdhE family)
VGRYLLAWELGGELGHARRQAAIARGLRRLGHEALLAFSDVTAVDVKSVAGIAWVPAPRVPPPDSPAPAPLSASDILVHTGYADAASLAGALAGWSGLLRAFRPSALVADYAPAAMLAARHAGIPRIAVGSGFSMPPLDDPMPALRPHEPVERATLEGIDARLLAAVQEACARVAGGASAPRRARELFEAEANVVCAWRELDPFGPRDGPEYVGPQVDAGELPTIGWQGASGPRVFAYLKPRDPRFPALLDALSRVAGEAIVAAPALAPEAARGLSSARVRVLPHAVDLAAALREADLCLAHSGAGTVAAATAAGVPLALLPLHLEQWLIARRVQALGYGVVRMEHGAGDLAAWLREALSNDELRGAARSAREARRPTSDAAARIAALA